MVLCLEHSLKHGTCRAVSVHLLGLNSLKFLVGARPLVRSRNESGTSHARDRVDSRAQSAADRVRLLATLIDLLRGVRNDLDDRAGCNLDGNARKF